MPKFRVLSDPSEQIAAYRADRRQNRAPTPPVVLEAYTRGIGPRGQFSQKRGKYILHTYRLAELRERWRARRAAARKGLGQIAWTVEKLRLLRAKVSDLLDDEARCHFLRHLVMRWSLGVVFAWFAAQQLYDPDGWVHFVPSFMQGVAMLPEAMLIRLHGTLLLVASVGLLAGVGVRLAAGLGAFILVQIIAGLAINGGESNLIARDVGLLGLALGLAFDPTRSSPRELSSILVSPPAYRQQPPAPPPIVAYSGNGAGAGYAARAHPARGSVMSEAGPFGNGDDYPLRESRAVPDAQLLAQHGEQPMKTDVGVNNFREDSAPISDLNGQHILRLAETMARLTWLIAGLAAVNVIATILIAAAAIFVISRGG